MNGAPMDLTHLSVTSAKVPGFLIKVKTIESSAFPTSRFVDSTVLQGKFDIIFIGGSDGPALVLGNLTRELVDRSFVQYHRGGGTIVFLHDSCRENQWEYFRNQMGPNQLMLPAPPRSWTEVRQKRPSDPPPVILTTPFKLPHPFSVAQTHSSQISSPNALLIGTQDEDTYYVERNGIAFCETSNTPWAVTKHEWRFLVNMTYHLTESRKPRSS